MDVLWIGTRDAKNNLAQYAAEHGMDNWLFDSDGRVVEHFNIQSGAGAVLITKDGRARARIDQLFNESLLRDLLDRAYARIGKAPEVTP